MGGAPRDLRSDFHFAGLLGKLHRRDLPDPHVLVLDERLARLDALRGIEQDGDRRAFAPDAMNGDTQRDERRDDRNDPDCRDAHALVRDRDRLREMAQIGLVSHAQHPR